MLHRESFRKKQESQTDDNRTAEEVVKDSRCPLPPTIENDLKVISRQTGVTHCELLEQFAVQGIELKKLEAECARQPEGSVRDEKCKYIWPK
jgi:hypothetical protein